MVVPHNDALVIRLQLGDCLVQRVLVDQGSSAEIIYYSLFKELGLSEVALRSATVPLIGFNGAMVWPLGLITLSVKAGTKNQETKFVVIDAPSPYNVILWRSWLHKMEALASTFHQVVCFFG